MSNEQWKANLAETTGQWAFVLTLSRNMINGLQAIRDSQSLPVEMSQFIACDKALKRRGLVEDYDTGNQRKGFNGLPVNVWKTRLTPAGAAVCDLLVMAGQMSKPRIRLENAA